MKAWEKKSQPVDESGVQFLMKMQRGASKQRLPLSGSEKGSIPLRSRGKWNAFCHKNLCLLAKSVKYSPKKIHSIEILSEKLLVVSETPSVWFSFHHL